MKKETKNLYNKKLLMLAILSLLFIFLIVLIGTLQGRYTFFFKRNGGSMVLGIGDKLPLSKLASDNMESLMQGAVSSTKDKISEKALDLEKSVRTSLEAQIKDMTDREIKAIKLKVCQDWGVAVNLTATPTP